MHTQALTDTQKQAGRKKEKPLPAHIFNSRPLRGDKRECMFECMMRISTGVGCRCCEQLVEDAFIKTHQGAESVERNREGKRLGRGTEWRQHQKYEETK